MKDSKVVVGWWIYIEPRIRPGEAFIEFDGNSTNVTVGRNPSLAACLDEIDPTVYWVVRVSPVVETLDKEIDAVRVSHRAHFDRSNTRDGSHARLCL